MTSKFNEEKKRKFKANFWLEFFSISKHIVVLIIKKLVITSTYLPCFASDNHENALEFEALNTLLNKILPYTFTQSYNPTILRSQ